MPASVVLFWFRRDLRLDDNTGLCHALDSGYPVLPIFIFDCNILDALPDKQDRRVQFIVDELQKINHSLHGFGSTLVTFTGDPLESFTTLCNSYTVAGVYCNHDYEPYAMARDRNVAALLAEKGIPLRTFKDQVIFEKNEICKDDGTPYTVFTPYSRKWLEKFNESRPAEYASEQNTANFLALPPQPIPSVHELGFKEAPYIVAPPQLYHMVAAGYEATRDFPALNGTTRLSVHLRFGTISIRKLAGQAYVWSPTLLNELIWRDFFQAILWHFPYVADGCFKREYDKIPWRNDPDEFIMWQTGTTGYPIVDAGMRQLEQTGYMHNRVRMITASFLTKHLLIDWRRGEAHFAQKLLDYDMAANNGGWQWAAGTGCDAAPYFRVFNPTLQAEKFDPEGKYIREWIPELDSLRYPGPMVDHKHARARCLAAYKSIKTQAQEDPYSF